MTSGGTAGWRAVLPGVDVTQQVALDGLRERITLGVDARARRQLSWQVQLTGLRPRLLPDGTVWLLPTSGPGHPGQRDPPLVILPPALTDAAGVPWPVCVTLTPLRQNGWLLSDHLEIEPAAGPGSPIRHDDRRSAQATTLDRRLPAALAPAYPLTLDPQVRITALGSGSEAVTRVGGAAPLGTPADALEPIGFDAGGHETGRAWLRFSLSDPFLAGAMPLQANFTVVSSGHGQDDAPICVRPATAGWDAGSITGVSEPPLGLPIVAGTATSAFGASFNPRSDALASLLEAWLHGLPNEGLCVSGEPGSRAWAGFVAGGAANPALAPALSVTLADAVPRLFGCKIRRRLIVRNPGPVALKPGAVVVARIPVEALAVEMRAAGNDLRLWTADDSGRWLDELPFDLRLPDSVAFPIRAEVAAGSTSDEGHVHYYLADADPQAALPSPYPLSALYGPPNVPIVSRVSPGTYAVGQDRLADAPPGVARRPAGRFGELAADGVRDGTGAGPAVSPAPPTDRWRPVGGADLAVDDSAAWDGPTSLAVTAGSAGAGAQQIVRGLMASHSYALQFRAQTPPGLEVEARYTDGGGITRLMIAGGTGFDGATGRPHVLHFTCHGDGAGSIAFQARAAGRFFLDTVQVVEGERALPFGFAARPDRGMLVEPERTNLVRDSSLECWSGGRLQLPWQTSAGTATRRDLDDWVHGGSSARIIAPMGGQLSQRMSGVKPGVRYQVSFWIKVIHGSVSGGWAGDGAKASSALKATAGPDVRWHRVVQSFVAHEQTGDVRFTAEAESTEFLVDAVQVEAGSYATSFIRTPGTGSRTRTPDTLLYEPMRADVRSSGAVSLWFKPEWSPGDLQRQRAVLWSLGGGSAGAPGFGLEAGPAGFRAHTPWSTLSAAFPNGSADSRWLPGSWHHVAVSWSATPGPQAQALYVDGAPVAAAATPAASRVVMGALVIGGPEPAGGVVSDFRIYGAALSPDSARALAANDRPVELEGRLLFFIASDHPELPLGYQAEAGAGQVAARVDVGAAEPALYPDEAPQPPPGARPRIGIFFAPSGDWHSDLQQLIAFRSGRGAPRFDYWSADAFLFGSVSSDRMFSHGDRTVTVDSNRLDPRYLMLLADAAELPVSLVYKGPLAQPAPVGFKLRTLFERASISTPLMLEQGLDRSHAAQQFYGPDSQASIGNTGALAFSDPDIARTQTDLLDYLRGRAPGGAWLGSAPDMLRAWNVEGVETTPEDETRFTLGLDRTTKASLWVDAGPAFSAQWQDWLQERYGSPAALKAAWGAESQPWITFRDVPLPDPILPPDRSPDARDEWRLRLAESFVEFRAFSLAMSNASARRELGRWPPRRPVVPKFFPDSAAVINGRHFQTDVPFCGLFDALGVTFYPPNAAYQDLDLGYFRALAHSLRQPAIPIWLTEYNLGMGASEDQLDALLRQPIDWGIDHVTFFSWDARASGSPVEMSARPRRLAAVRAMASRRALAAGAARTPLNLDDSRDYATTMLGRPWDMRPSPDPDLRPIRGWQRFSLGQPPSPLAGGGYSADGLTAPIGARTPPAALRLRTGISAGRTIDPDRFSDLAFQMWLSRPCLWRLHWEPPNPRFASGETPWMQGAAGLRFYRLNLHAFLGENRFPGSTDRPRSGWYNQFNGAAFENLSELEVQIGSTTQTPAPVEARIGRIYLMVWGPTPISPYSDFSSPGTGPDIAVAQGESPIAVTGQGPARWRVVVASDAYASRIGLLESRHSLVYSLAAPSTGRYRLDVAGSRAVAGAGSGFQWSIRGPGLDQSARASATPGREWGIPAIVTSYGDGYGPALPLDTRRLPQALAWTPLARDLDLTAGARYKLTLTPEPVAGRPNAIEFAVDEVALARTQ